MTNTFTVASPHTGRIFEFESEAAYEAASAWYDAASKREIMDFVGKGFAKRNGMLVEDWALIAMHAKAGDVALVAVLEDTK